MMDHNAHRACNQSYVRSVALSSQEAWLAAAATGTGPVRVWNTATGAIEKRLSGFHGSALAVAFSPDDTLLAGAVGTGREGQIMVWKWQDEKVLWEFSLSDDGTAVAFSRDGLTLAGGTYGGEVCLWGVQRGRLLRTLVAPARVRSIAFAPDGKWIMAGSSDGSLRFWDARDRGVLQTFTAHDDTVTSVAVSPDVRHIATGSLDGSIKLWAIE